MFYANKKHSAPINSAEQNAKILANVKGLLEKKLIQFNGNVVSLYPQLWKDKEKAINWIKCLYIYCNLKKQIKAKEALYFEDIITKKIIGSMVNNVPKLIEFEFEANNEI
ncbi:hypothetical protein [Pedobacter xixiisoli]|uniref:Uncharacterized protein n=1 Tax=Pedobacter xixiisoli TaxID=1476464 RepID=A0A285ZTT8_9SPHI|nr:hypothetical protein [Pedobacter xixiisoli]SOD13060.1 hypothetical protein SAMN06297358_0987 [Pedobacter xixiisoli]